MSNGKLRNEWKISPSEATKLHWEKKFYLAKQPFLVYCFPNQSVCWCFSVPSVFFKDSFGFTQVTADPVQSSTLLSFHAGTAASPNWGRASVGSTLTLSIITIVQPPLTVCPSHLQFSNLTEHQHMNVVPVSTCIKPSRHITSACSNSRSQPPRRAINVFEDTVFLPLHMHVVTLDCAWVWKHGWLMFIQCNVVHV